jgi:hypothetical protein
VGAWKERNSAITHRRNTRTRCPFSLSVRIGHLLGRKSNHTWKPSQGGADDCSDRRFSRAGQPMLRPDNPHNFFWPRGAPPSLIRVRRGGRGNRERLPRRTECGNSGNRCCERLPSRAALPPVPDLCGDCSSVPLPLRKRAPDHFILAARKTPPFRAGM